MRAPSVPASAPRTVRVAVAQSGVPAYLAAGVEHVTRLTADATAHRTSLLVFPETYLPGHPAGSTCAAMFLFGITPR
jgi:predicted amidohydrolase